MSCCGGNTNECGSDDVHAVVKDYYGKQLETTSSLKTDACLTSSERPTATQMDAMKLIHDEVQSKYYGCGLVAPEAVEECSVLDLGCGAGRDVYLLAKLVGEKGRVVGVDMTDEQLDVARKHEEYHREAFGYKESNVSFVKSTLEDLDVAMREGQLAEKSFDIIVSNCVINLVKDKKKVLQHAYNLLKPGGEMYFSDVYSHRRVSQELLSDPVLYGECLSGALYVGDFYNTAAAVGFSKPLLVKGRVLGINNKAIAAKLGSIEFSSHTYRLFRANGLEPGEEDFGQAVVYHTTMFEGSTSFPLSQKHVFELGKVTPVSGNVFAMLYQSRFRPFFHFYGDGDTHYGAFEA